MALGDDEDMDGRLGLDVLERQQLIIFVDAGRRDFPGDNLAEQARHEGEYSPLGRRPRCCGGHR
jgi:hypothetical protein